MDFLHSSPHRAIFGLVTRPVLIIHQCLFIAEEFLLHCQCQLSQLCPPPAHCLPLSLFTGGCRVKKRKALILCKSIGCLGLCARALHLENWSQFLHSQSNKRHTHVCFSFTHHHFILQLYFPQVSL